MSERYKVYNDQIPHFITFTVVGWVDVFSRELYKDILCKSLIFCMQKKGLKLHAWVFMTNHVHLIVSTSEGKKIGNFIRDMKKHTANEIIKAITKNNQESRRAWMLNMFEYTGRNNNNNEQYQFWQQDYHPICLDSHEKTRERLHYLHNNPVKSGIVWLPEDYKHSSATDYYTNRKGLLPLIKLDFS